MMSYCKKIVLVFSGISLGFLAAAVYGDLAPVVDITQSSSQSDANSTSTVTVAPLANNETSVNPSAANSSGGAVNSSPPSDTSTAANAPNTNEMNAPVMADNKVSPATQTPAPLPDTSGMTDEQRIARLEQQLANMVQMNYPQQVSDMQQQIQQLQGQLQVESHDLQQLKDQQKSFYQDLDTRLTQLKNANQASNNASSVSIDATPVPSTADATSSEPVSEVDVYRNAFTMLLNKQYGQAQVAFQNYVNLYPKGQYIANAHFWLGEISMVQKKYPIAQKEFNTVVQQFSTSDKVPDSKLKLAMIDAATGKAAQARQELLAIKRDHPNSTAAQLASIQLQQMDLSKNNSNSLQPTTTQ